MTIIDSNDTVLAPGQVTLGMALRPFWAVIWRGILIGLAILTIDVAATLIPYCLGLTKFHHAIDAIKVMQHPVVGIARFFSNIVISCVLYGIVFNRAYRDFSMVPRSTLTNEVIDLGFNHTIKLWWSIVWRTFLLTLAVILGATILGFLVGFAAGFAGIHIGNAGQALVILVASLLLFAVFTFIFLKIYAIVMQKRYSNFYLTVVPHSALTTSA